MEKQLNKTIRLNTEKLIYLKISQSFSCFIAPGESEQFYDE